MDFSRPRRVDLMWDGSRMLMFVSCDDRMNMGLCLYGGEDGGASPNPESVGYNKICQIPPWLCQPGRHHPTLIDEKGKIPSITCHESTSSLPPSPFQPIKVQHPAFSPKHIRLRLGMDCVGMGKLSQSCQMIHTRLAKGAQWVKEQDPIFRSKSRRRRRKISKTQVRPLSKQADLIGGKNKLGIGQVWW